MASFEENLLNALKEVFQPLTTALTDVADLSALLSELGWQLDQNDPAWPTNQAATLSGLFGNVTTLVNGLSTDPATLASQIPPLANAIEQLAPGTINAALPSPLGTAGFWSEFPSQLFPYLVFVYLRAYAPAVFGAARFLGVLTQQAQPANSTVVPPRPAYTAYSIDWGKLDQFVSAPAKLLSNLYGWGTPAFDAQNGLLLESIADLLGIIPLSSSGEAAMQRKAPKSLLSLYYDNATSAAGSYGAVSAGLKYALSGGTPIAFRGAPRSSACRFRVPVKNTPPATGLALFPLITGALGQNFNVTDNVQITVNGDFAIVPVIAEIRPGPPVSVTLNTSFAKAPTVDAEVRLDAKNTKGWIVVGTSDSSNLQLLQVHVRFGANGPISDVTYAIEGGIDHGQLIIDFSDADSFVQSIFGDAPVAIDLGAVLSWSSKAGFGFAGSTNLQLTLALHQTLFGVVTIDTLTVGFNPGPSIPLAVSGNVLIGPVSATVDRIGFQVDFLQTPDHSGTFGDVDVRLGFKPPDGLGVDLDLGPVSGGGYFSYDATKQEYAGIIAASFGAPMQTIDLELIGILDTILPGGASGYSFLLIVTVDFPPIQLGFGFTLNGVGGLAGINRSMVLAALQTAVHNGTADNILFPVDPIAHATDIISTVSAVFPAAAGRYTFGPMLDLGYGTPQILDVQLGIIIEVPAPIRLAILGLIELGLPSLEVSSPNELIVDINIDVVGTVDFDQRQLIILATIYDLRVADFALSGNMYMQLDWGAAPQFVVSLGGFNPHFQPPPGSRRCSGCRSGSTAAPPASR